jgi:hypothetical protein
VSGAGARGDIPEGIEIDAGGEYEGEATEE